MKVAATCLASLLLLPPVLVAQSSVYLSNLSTPSAFPPIPINNNGWLGQKFRTGNHADGYLFDWAQLSMDVTFGNPGGFSVLLYNTSFRAGGEPDEELAILTGPAPSLAGVYTYSASGSVSLLPATDYFVVVHATAPTGTGSYRWKQASSGSYQGLDGWQMYLNQHLSGDGLNWSLVNILPCQFAIGATAIPEPSAFGLLGLWGVILLAMRPFMRRE